MKSRARIWLRRWWESLSWGPLYFLRRLTCHVRGHQWRTEHLCEVDFIGHTYCWRCMEGADDGY